MRCRPSSCALQGPSASSQKTNWARHLLGQARRTEKHRKEMGVRSRLQNEVSGREMECSPPAQRTSPNIMQLILVAQPPRYPTAVQPISSWIIVFNYAFYSACSGWKRTAVWKTKCFKVWKVWSADYKMAICSWYFYNPPPKKEGVKKVSSKQPFCSPSFLQEFYGFHGLPKRQISRF